MPHIITDKRHLASKGVVRVYFFTEALAEFQLVNDSTNLGSQDSCMLYMLGLKLLLRQLSRLPQWYMPLARPVEIAHFSPALNSKQTL